MKCFELVTHFLVENNFEVIDRTDYEAPYIAIKMGGVHFTDINVVDINGKQADDGAEIFLGMPGMAMSYASFNLAEPSSLEDLVHTLNRAYSAYKRSLERRDPTGLSGPTGIQGACGPPGVTAAEALREIAEATRETNEKLSQFCRTSALNIQLLHDASSSAEPIDLPASGSSLIVELAATSCPSQPP